MQRRTTALTAAVLSLLPLGQPLLMGTLGIASASTAVVLQQTRAVAQDSDAVTAVHYGQQRMNSGDFQEAIIYFDKAVAIDPNYDAAYSNRGGAKWKLKRYQEAIADYDRAIIINPKHAYAYANRGQIKVWDLNDYQGGLYDISKASIIEPKNARILAMLGAAKMLNGDPRGACTEWEKAVSLGDKNSAEFLERDC